MTLRFTFRLWGYEEFSGCKGRKYPTETFFGGDPVRKTAPCRFCFFKIKPPPAGSGKGFIVLEDALSSCSSCSSSLRRGFSSRGCSRKVSGVLKELNGLPSTDMEVLLSPLLRVPPKLPHRKYFRRGPRTFPPEGPHGFRGGAPDAIDALRSNRYTFGAARRDWRGAQQSLDLRFGHEGVQGRRLCGAAMLCRLQCARFAIRWRIADALYVCPTRLTLRVAIAIPSVRHFVISPGAPAGKISDFSRGARGAALKRANAL